MNTDPALGVNTSHVDEMNRTVITCGQNKLTLSSAEVKDLNDWVTSASKSLARTVSERQNQAHMAWEHNYRERLRDCLSMGSHEARFIANRPAFAVPRKEVSIEYQ